MNKKPIKKIWIVEYTTTAEFAQQYGFSLKIKKTFKNKLAAISFINDMKINDTENFASRNVTIYEE